MIGRYRARKVFSLLEILIVMGIIASLVAIALPMFSSHVDDAKYGTAKENLRVLRKALDDFKGDHGRFPLADSFFTESNELLVGKAGTKYTYLRDIPKDPFTESSGTWIITRSSHADGDVVSNISNSMINED